MGFIDFLKSLTGKKEVKEKEQEKINFEELEKWLIKKRKELSIQEQSILDLIQNQISAAIESLKENLNVLKSVDIDSKKAEYKLKLIVKENLNNYVYYVSNFTEALENLREQELEKLLINANKIFADFDKRSYLSYQKVTFLVGKEMANIKNEILKLSKYLEKIFEENKSLIEYFKTINFVEKKLKHLDGHDKITNEVNKKINFLKEKQETLKKAHEETSKEVEEVKKTKEYLENLEKKEEAEIHKKELEKEIHSLKNETDFKVLKNIFHMNEKEMKIIKEHEENFKKAFQETQGQEILRLLKEGNLNNEKIPKKIKQIGILKGKLNEELNAIEKDKAEELFLKINNLNLEIEELKREHENELKKHEKIQMSRQETLILIKQELEKIDVFVIG